MKTIGLLGGMSWESTVTYYQLLNRMVAERLGGLHSAPILLYSVDFEPIEKLQAADRWQEAGEVLADFARRLQDAGAEGLALCTNTMHRVADPIQAAIDIPLLHIADATGLELRRKGIAKVGLLGTRFTMEEEFYRGHLERRYGMEVLIPPKEDRLEVHRVIFDELCRGRIESASRRRFVDIISRLQGSGAEGVILGCTEIPLLVKQGDVLLPLLDTTAIHARSIAEWALE